MHPARISHAIMKKFLLLFSLVLATAHAGVSKWVDAEGKVHYGDRPPASGASTTPLRGTVSLGDGITVVPDAGTAAPAGQPAAGAAATPRNGEVWIYTTPTCGYCNRAKDHMKARHVRYVEKDITANAQYKTEFRNLGGRGVPVTLSGSRRINGYTAEKFDAFLKSSGL